MEPQELRFVEVEPGVRLSVTLQGNGPPVLLLHGFPQCAYAWRHIVPALADSGFRAIAPDMRGYDRSDKPHPVSAYRIERLVADVRALVHALGYDKVSLVGHDWGGAVAWSVAALHPELVDRLIILNCPPPAALVRELRRNPKQRRMSWYMFFFQLPLAPEVSMKRKGGLERIFRGMSTRPEVFSDEDIAYYRAALEKPGAARSMINYYRASGRSLLGRRTRSPRVARPTLILWGMQDAALSASMLSEIDRYVDSPEIVRLSDASHWVVEEKPDQVRSEITRFLRARA